MTKPAHTIEIDRIVLTDLGVTPGKAAHIREMVEVELARLFQQEKRPEGLAGREISRLEVPAMHLSAPSSNHQLAAGLARSVARGLGLGGSK